jgi:2,3-dihydroxybenzoate decarboxylase
MTKKIALEEHFLAPGCEEYWATTVADLDRAIYDQVVDRLKDFGERRLEAMDRAGIERAVLSLSGPGVQIERDRVTACRRARAANDFLAREIQARPDRYSGFAHLPMQDPIAAAAELERCVHDLGFRGAMINGHTNGVYLDDPMIDPFWARVETLGVPIYLHPADPPGPYPAVAGCSSLKRAMWEWGVETGSHALRLVFGGVFDRFPGVTLILGHLGETLPYLLWRFDSRAAIYGLRLQKRPSDYIRAHVVVTTSGMFSAEPLACAINALGADRVMFSVDYPYESSEHAAQFIENVLVDEPTRRRLCFENAERVLGWQTNEHPAASPVRM